MLEQPRSLLEFQRDFPDDAACIRYLAGRRWPDGFVCPACGATRAHELVGRRLWQCAACRAQTSLTAGTVLHGTRLPLITWFWAMYLAATLNTGISARQLRKQLGLRRYETAWMLLHKIRLAMVNPQREPLSGEVEVGQTWVGGSRGGPDRARPTTDGKAVLVAIAVEHHGHSLGRLRMEVIPDASGPTLTDFVLRNVAPGSTLHGDSWAGSNRLLAGGYRGQGRAGHAVRGADEEINVVPGVHRVAANLRTWLRATHRGVGADHLERYLEEFVFRFNRRFYPMAAFDTLLGLTSRIEPTAY
ncbi:MAG: IS1595 family transposase, partial [Candidatus Limnocylindrales bacterium]